MLLVALVCWSGAPGKLLELHTHWTSRSTSQVLACWRVIGQSGCYSSLLARLLWETRQGYPLFIEAAFTAIYHTGGQCGRYNLDPDLIRPSYDPSSYQGQGQGVKKKIDK